MAVADWEKVCLACFKSGARGRALALWTMPVTTAVIGDAPLAAVLANFNMAAERSGAAMLDCCHNPELLEAKMSGMSCPISGARTAKDIGDLQSRGHCLSQSDPCLPSEP